MIQTKLLPILRCANWPAAVLAVHRPLFEERYVPETRDTIPLVSFAYDTPEATYAITWDALEDLRRTLDQVWYEALTNLARVEVQWRVTLRHSDGTPKAITGYGEYASETILSRSVMLWLQEQLGARGLVVAIPTRGELVAQDAFAPEPLEEVAALAEWASARFMRAGEDAITPDPIVVHDGDVVGAIHLPPTKATVADVDDANETGNRGRVLRAAAYLTRERCFEYTCHLPPDRAVSRAELEEIHGLVSARRTADGRPVERVRVLFYDEEMARRAGPRLAALGAEICYLHPETGRPEPLA